MNMNNSAPQRRRDDMPVELESQFILRMPEEPAESLRSALRSGTLSVKDRFSIQVEADMRHGTVKWDNYTLPAKLVDIPTIIESMKTINRKTFYKTADICQMLLCKDEDSTGSDEGDSSPVKKKDPNKVDKKYLYPHGLTPPLKNVRKKRFRRTLKKNVENAPEIEKEVKRLLRTDNEALAIKWDLVANEDEKTDHTNSQPQSTTAHSHVGEHDLFGDDVSDSDDEERRITSNLDDDDSRLSMPDTDTPHQDSGIKKEPMAMDFSQSSKSFPGSSSSYMKMESDESDVSYTAQPQHYPPQKQGIEEEYELLCGELSEIRAQRVAQEKEFDQIDNLALRSRLTERLHEIRYQEHNKLQRYNELKSLLRR